MECSCVMICDSYEVADVHRAERPIARKLYSCNECGGDISIGWLYERSVMLYDGVWETHRVCHDCLSLRDTLFCAGYYYGILWEDFKQWVFDCCGQINFNKLAELTPLAREKVCEIIEDYWEEYDSEDV